jgi:hypothetical protein
MDKLRFARLDIENKLSWKMSCMELELARGSGLFRIGHHGNLAHTKYSVGDSHRPVMSL